MEPFLQMELPDHILYTYQQIADVDLHLAGSLLSEKERLYLEQVKHDGRRREFTAGRIVARQFAGSILNCKPEDVSLMVAEDGSLLLPGTEFGISLAHSHQGVCVVVATSCDVGIDLETIKPRHQDLYRFILHPEEYPLLDTLALDRDSMLILFWALKEATLKGMKTGFRCSPKKLRLSIDLEHNQAEIVVLDQGSDLDKIVWQGHFEKTDGCFLTIAYPK